MSVTIPLTKLTQPGLFMRRTYNPLSDYTLIRVLRANREGRLSTTTSKGKRRAKPYESRNIAIYSCDALNTDTIAAILAGDCSGGHAGSGRGRASRGLRDLSGADHRGSGRGDGAAAGDRRAAGAPRGHGVSRAHGPLSVVPRVYCHGSIAC